jgi:hypothetical protein
MARLIVEAVRNEDLLMEDAAAASKLALLVSVSDATTGMPVNQLQTANFIVTPGWTMAQGYTLALTATELSSVPQNKPSGIYRLTVTLMNTSSFPVGFAFDGGVNYALGVQVIRDPDPTIRGYDAGQTVVTVMGYGHQVLVRT